MVWRRFCRADLREEQMPMKSDPPTSDAPRSTNHESRHPTPAPSDAEKYRWIRAHRGNFAISQALDNSDRDADFDSQIEREMTMTAAGRDSYGSGGRL
jgi:hypothetical protein